MFVATVVSWICFVSTYILCCKFYPSSITEDKLSSGVKSFSKAELNKIFRTSLINLSLSLPLGLFFELVVPVIFVPWWFIRIPLSLILFDCVYYSLHNMFHNISWLKCHHDKHHEYNLSNPISTFYASYIESIILNMGTVGMFPYLLGFTTIEMVIWFTGIALFTSMLHSKFRVSDDFHMIHHYKRYCNYSIFGFADLLFGTFYTKFSFDAELQKIKSYLPNEDDWEDYIVKKLANPIQEKIKKLY